MTSLRVSDHIVKQYELSSVSLDEQISEIKYEVKY